MGREKIVVIKYCYCMLCVCCVLSAVQRAVQYTHDMDYIHVLVHVHM